MGEPTEQYENTVGIGAQIVLGAILLALLGGGWFLYNMGQCNKAKDAYGFDYSLAQISSEPENVLEARIGRSDVVKYCGERAALEVELAQHEKWQSF